jgi:NADH:ubiquinone oxidoreductase subunit 5 (subunit L)/multisubunit Na+/H+ antiporter MnhA subunit
MSLVYITVLVCYWLGWYKSVNEGMGAVNHPSLYVLCKSVMLLMIVLPWFVVSALCYMSSTLGYRGSSRVMLIGLMPSVLCAWLGMWLTLSNGDYSLELVYMCIMEYCVTVSLSLTFWTSIWCVLLCVVSYCIHCYTLWYISDSIAMSRFLGTLSMFTGGMCTLLLSGDMITLFIGWELIGISSFLLVSHNNTRVEAVRAGLKALIYNRVGDLGMLLGICLGLVVYGDTCLTLWCYLDCMDISSDLSSTRTLLCTLLLLGAWSKSAQFGLNPWLLDAMEGPTPVSALLHSATLVTAGVVMLCKISAIWVMCPSICMFMYVLGLVTALSAAMCGLFYMDTKRVVAYSTCTHVGMMIFSLGLSGLTVYGDGGGLGTSIYVGSWHMFVHGWSKSLLFLLCGSLLHQLHQQDLRMLTGVSVRSVPVYGVFFSLSLLSLAGCPGSAISESKDWILEMGCLCITGSSLVILMLTLVSLSQGYSLGLILHMLSDMGKFSFVSMNMTMFLPMLALILNVVYIPMCFSDILLNSGLEPSERMGMWDGFGLFSLVGLSLGLLNGTWSVSLLGLSVRNGLMRLVLNRFYLDKLLNSIMLYITSWIVTRVQYDVEYGFLMVVLSPLASNRVSICSSVVYSGTSLLLGSTCLLFSLYMLF